MLVVSVFLLPFTCLAAENKALSIVSSSDADSSRINSFVYLNDVFDIPQGIKKTAAESLLKLQIPFVIDLPVDLKPDEKIQWIVKTKSEYIGEIEMLSRFSFSKEGNKNSFEWVSAILKNDIEDRHRLVFRPEPLQHKPAIYKKGRGRNNKRRRYGGGTTKINDTYFNPRLSYQILAMVSSAAGIQTYKGKIEMDNKDMVRQEFINHYGINRYGRGDYGNLPVPARDELSSIPDMPKYLLGNALSESRYGLMIDDGLTRLATDIVRVFENAKKNYKLSGKSIIDLTNKKLPVPESELWLSGGWRNPERNEWFSNALNGIHQRGGAIDVVANEPHSDIRSAIVYWFLWQVLEEKNSLNAFWQLETHGRPMTTREFNEDIEPKNGIPDAFDKADHMHINIKYE